MRKPPLPPPLGLVLLLVASPSWSGEEPGLAPTRDVDVLYEENRPGRQTVSERVRWLSADHLERIDGPGKSTTIIDLKAKEVTLLNHDSSTYSYSHLKGASSWPTGPLDSADLTRRGESVVAGLRCAEWSWTDGVELRAACITPDGVLLRLVVDGKTVVEARSVSYDVQDEEIFQIPPDYTPAVMAPEARKLIR
jgi:hypothetical protein